MTLPLCWSQLLLGSLRAPQRVSRNGAGPRPQALSSSWGPLHPAPLHPRGQIPARSGCWVWRVGGVGAWPQVCLQLAAQPKEPYFLLGPSLLHLKLPGRVASTMGPWENFPGPLGHPLRLFLFPSLSCILLEGTSSRPRSSGLCAQLDLTCVLTDPLVPADPFPAPMSTSTGSPVRL